MTELAEQPNFMLLDLWHTALAFSLYPLFFLVPGYVLGWLSNVLDFRQRSAVTRVLLSLTLSISLTPVLTYLVARWLSFFTVWVFYGLVWAAAIGIVLRHLYREGFRSLRPKWPNDRATRFALLVALVWLLIGTFSLIDLQVGQRLYFSVTSDDYTKNISVTDAITRTGVLPVNPSFHPGHDVMLFYYYFWFLVCSLMDRVGGALIDARGAVFGATLWAGLALMACVALALRFLHPNDRLNVRVRALTGITLLGITGLDIFAVAAETAMSFALGKQEFRSDPEWWNEQVTAWTDTALWVPHHLAGFIACFTGFLLLRTLDFRQPFRKQWSTILLMGLAFASATGLSIWVTLVFAVFLAIWIVVTILGTGTPYEKRAEIRTLVLAGVIAAVCALPFLLDLQNANQLESQFPVSFQVRRFLPVTRLLEASENPEIPGTLSSPLQSLLYLALLPINYLLEFGYFAIGALIFWQARSRQKQPLSRGETALLTLAVVSLAVSTFFVSNMRNNDLGWRGLLFAQFVLLLWTVDFTVDFWWQLRRLPALNSFYPNFAPRFRREVLILLLAGELSTTYSLFTLRAYPVLSDLRVLSVPNEFFYDYQAGERIYAMRALYTALQDRLPKQAITQHNSDVQLERFHALYGQRQVVFSDRDLGTVYGIATGSALVPFGAERAEQDPYAAEARSVPLYEQVSDIIAAVFADDSSPAAAKDLCATYAISVLIVKDTDPIWSNQDSWVWRVSPMFASDFARAFDCATLFNEAVYVRPN